MRLTFGGIVLLALLVVIRLPAIASTRTVSGHMIGHYTNGTVPVDLSTQTVAAFVPNGSGGYNEVVGSGTSTGTFTISDVPTGFYLLELGGQYLWTSKTDVNADYYDAYRSTRTEAGAGTTLTFDLANLNPWQDTDIFELSDPNSSAFDGYATSSGATTFTGTFSYTDYLCDYTQHDKTYITQLIAQNIGGYYFTAAGRFFAPHDFVQTNGGNTTVSGTLKTLDQNQTFRANINGADIAAQALAANPGATLELTIVVLDAFPGSLAKGWTTNTPDLISYVGPYSGPLLDTNMDFGDISYGNPYPDSFTLFDIYLYSAQTNYLAPGATNSTALTTEAEGWTTALPSETTPMGPLVGTVTDPLVAGKNFFANQSGIQVTPRLSWSPPSVGTASVYEIFVYQLLNNSGNTEYTQVAQLQTQSTSLRIPQGLLSAGQAYVFQIRATYLPGVNLTTDPYYLGPTDGFADVISGVMQP